MTDFDGYTLNEDPDAPRRLGRQLALIRARMRDGEWHSLDELADWACCKEQSASARVRDLRKPKFGGHEIERRLRWPGHYEYQMVLEGQGALL